MTYRRVLDWVSGSTDTLHIQFGTAGNYSAIADLHILQFTVTRLDSVQFLCSEAHILAGWRLETRLTLLNWTNHFARTKQETQPLYCWEGVFTASLHSNGSYLIVACIFLVAGTCLRSRCLAINIYSDFTIPAFERHVTIYYSNLSME
jgi:hypothetical protein